MGSLPILRARAGTESTLADDARAVETEHDIEIAAEPGPDRNFFIRTDQYSAVLAGVPALAMKFGWTKDSPEFKEWRQWLAQLYHSMEDNLSQPVDTAAAAHFNGFLGDRARRVAKNPGRPLYVKDLEQPSSIGGGLVALGDHLSNLGLLLIEELRAATTDATFLASGIQPGLGPLF